jgi:type IV secretory pathway VirB2 component (pilin)
MKLKDKLAKAFALTRQASVLALGLAASLSALQVRSATAQTTGASGIAQPIVTIAQQVQSVMEGPLGVSVFIIGLGALGMACLRGIIPWGWVVAWIVGACFLFGAPEVVSTIQSAVGSSS